MLRAISLLVVLAHLSVASIPCSGAGAMEETPIPTGVSQIHHLPVAAEMPPQPVTRNADPSGHEHTDAHDGHQRHAAAGGGRRDHDHHDHGNHDEAKQDLHAQAKVETKIDTEVALLELHAPCLCGCSKNTNSQGTTSSPRLGFALFPPRPIPLPESVPSFHAAEIDPMPTSLADPLDHIPISS